MFASRGNVVLWRGTFDSRPRHCSEIHWRTSVVLCCVFCGSLCCGLFCCVVRYIGVPLSRLKVSRNANGELEKCRELSKLIAFILLLCLAFLRLQVYVAAGRDPQNNHLEGSIGGWEVIWVMPKSKHFPREVFLKDDISFDSNYWHEILLVLW